MEAWRQTGIGAPSKLSEAAVSVGLIMSQHCCQPPFGKLQADSMGLPMLSHPGTDQANTCLTVRMQQCWVPGLYNSLRVKREISFTICVLYLAAGVCVSGWWWLGLSLVCQNQKHIGPPAASGKPELEGPWTSTSWAFMVLNVMTWEPL